MLSPHRRWTSRAQLGLELLETRETPAVFATGSTPGTDDLVTVYDASTLQPKFTITPFGGAFTGGVHVAVADLNGDGGQEIIAAPGVAGGPVVEIYSATDGTLIRSLLVGDPNTRVGVGLATTNLGQTGASDLVLGTVVGGVSTVEILTGDGTSVKSFVPFHGFTGSLSVATADVNGDGVPDYIVGAGAGGGPRLSAFDGSTGAVLFNQFVFAPTFTGGVSVAAGDLRGDGKTEVVVAPESLGGPRVEGFDPADGWSQSFNFFAFDSTERVGAQIAVFDQPSEGNPELVVAPGPGGSGGLAAFDGRTLAPVTPPTLAGLPPSSPTTPTSPPGTSTSNPPGSTLPFSLGDPAWQKLSNGVRIWDVKVGSGTPVQVGNIIHVTYIGYLTDGTILDSSTNLASPFSSLLDTSHLIAGWVNGVPGMQPGGERRLDIPASLAYGSTGHGSVPPNAELVFDITLIS